MNVCDMPATPEDAGGFEQAARFVLACSHATGIDRVYVGSYFCDRAFLMLADAHFEALADFAAAYDVAATLVVPIFAQATLAAGSRRVEELLSSGPCRFDEVTVNDYATAEQLAPMCRDAGIAMNWGRLLAKQLRDPRHIDFACTARTCEIDAEEAAQLASRYPLGLIELDPFAPCIDVSPLAGTPFALHAPRSFATTGHICEAASAPRELADSFRADAPCTRECARTFTSCFDDAHGVWFTKHGRSVYFENAGCVTCGGQPARIVYSAADFSERRAATWA